MEQVAAETLSFAANSPSEVQVLAGQILTILQRPVIDLLNLRGFILRSGGGLPPHPFCAPTLRVLVWKLLLGILPPVREEWDPKITSQRELYDQYVYDLIHEPELITNLRYGSNTPSPVARRGMHAFPEDGDDTRGPVTRVPMNEDHPLSQSSSMWRRYWLDSEIFDSVNKDVFRTRLDMDFFFSEIPTTSAVRGRCLTESTIIHRGGDIGSPKNHSFVVSNIASPKTHYDRICRILFLFAKLNFGYVQGMNEIIAVLYYTLYSGTVDSCNVEADTFFALTAIMQEHRDIFCQTLDECNSGMLGRLRVLQELIEREDPQVGSHFEKLELTTDFFAVRWITLLLASEFDIESVQVLWDSIFSDLSPTGHVGNQRNSLLHFLCVAMIIRVRDVLLAGDFTDCMNTLQRYPPFNVRELLIAAVKLKTARLSLAQLEPSDSCASLDPEVLEMISQKDETVSSPVRNFFHQFKRKLQRQKD